MAKIINFKCKLCRREGQKLYLKGERCASAKCALTRRNYPPGVHGIKGYPHQSDYGLQLREKQKIKRFYGLSERQLKRYFNLAQKRKGKTTENLARLLILRLDNVTQLVNLANSHSQARQMINHGFIKVNNKKVTIPSFQLKVGDVISLVPTKTKKKIITNQQQEIKKSSNFPTWIKFDPDKLEAKMISLPGLESALLGINFQLIVEYYSK